MHHAAKAYGRVAQQTASPRDLEAQLLLRAAARLQTIHDDWEGQQSLLDNALIYNRNLWIIFLTSVTSGDNPLPAAIRQNIANIGLFVMIQTLCLGFAPTQAGLRSLISINKQIAAGLSNRT